MKLYTLFYKMDKPFLREKNPLQGEKLISDAAYAEHERLYIESALRFICKNVPGRTVFTSNELKIVWQFREKENFVWMNVEGEPSFINTTANQYRQVFQLVNEPTYQERVKDWIVDCFGAEYAANKKERCLRYLEESMELLQSLGIEKEDVFRMAVRTFGRPIGDPFQEVGGALVTLAALCATLNIDMQSAGEIQIAENIKNSDSIKVKHLLKIQEGIAL